VLCLTLCIANNDLVIDEKSYGQEMNFLAHPYEKWYNHSSTGGVYMENIKDLISWLLTSEDIDPADSGSIHFELPKYEISPNRFLEFAEIDLKDDSVKGKVNTVSNLKRALDCQLDMFFETLNLKKIFDKYNLKFEKKTIFLADVGMFPNQSINKLNKIRNKMEHHYETPAMEDLNVYYELVQNMLEIVDLNLQLMSMGEIGVVVKKQGKEFYFSSNYNLERSEIVFEVEVYASGDKKSIKVALEKIEDYNDYIKAFCLFRYMIRFSNVFDVEYFIQQLQTLNSDKS